MGAGEVCRSTQNTRAENKLTVGDIEYGQRRGLPLSPLEIISADDIDLRLSERHEFVSRELEPEIGSFFLRDVRQAVAIKIVEFECISCYIVLELTDSASLLFGLACDRGFCLDPEGFSLDYGCSGCGTCHKRPYNRHQTTRNDRICPTH